MRGGPPPGRCSAYDADRGWRQAAQHQLKRADVTSLAWPVGLSDVDDVGGEQPSRTGPAPGGTWRSASPVVRCSSNGRGCGMTIAGRQARCPVRGVARGRDEEGGRRPQAGPGEVILERTSMRSRKTRQVQGAFGGAKYERYPDRGLRFTLDDAAEVGARTANGNGIKGNGIKRNGIKGEGFRGHARSPDRRGRAGQRTRRNL